jgi:hypothetical protein
MKNGQGYALVWTLVVLAVVIPTVAAGPFAVDAPLQAFVCQWGCPSCADTENNSGYPFKLNSCGTDGSTQGKNFTSFTITNATAEADSFSFIFFDDRNCSKEITRTPACSLSTCCPVNFTLGSMHFKAFRVRSAVWPSPSPSPSPAHNHSGDENVPPLWTIIVMASLGGVAALLLVIVVVLVVLVCRRGRGRGPHYRPLPTN